VGVEFFERNDKMPGLSTKPKLNSQAKKIFEKIGAEIIEIDVSRLTLLEVIQDGEEHASIAPKGWFNKSLSKEKMLEILQEWATQGEIHPLSIELKNAMIK
jgi:hypothetical protein